MGADAGKPRVLIADDSAVTRYGLRTALEQAGLEVCAEAEDGAEAVELALRENPDVCLLDVVMPKGGGIRAVREISRSLPDTAILMLSGSDAGEDVLGALQQGAWGYVLKDEDLGEITKAVRAAAAGERPLSKRAVRDLMDEARVRARRDDLADGRGALLTEREWEVLELLAGERSEQDVALRLGLDEMTVTREANEAQRKLGAGDRQAAMDLVRRLRAT